MKKHPPLTSFAVLLLGIGGCSTNAVPDGQNGSSAPAAAPAPGQTASSPDVSLVAASPADLSVTSTPAAGSTVAGPLNQIILDFSAPVALGEVLVTGPDGVMPMMVGSAGLQTHYSIPVSGLMSGSYTLAWKATLGGERRSGSFAFTIK